MTDLRIRIARNLGSNYGLADDGYSQDDLLRMADGLIHELGLIREGPNQAWIDAELPIRYRYVTEWTTDD
jgi:hypothetical protein